MSVKTESISFTHGDVSKEFFVTQLAPTRALKLATRLGKLLGPALPDLLGASGGLQGIGDMDASKLGGAVQKLLAEIEDTDSLLADLLQGVTVQANGKRVDVSLDVFNREFSGHLKDSLSLLVFGVKVNFSDFFGGSGGTTA